MRKRIAGSNQQRQLLFCCIVFDCSTYARSPGRSSACPATWLLSRCFIANGTSAILRSQPLQAGHAPTAWQATMTRRPRSDRSCYAGTPKAHSVAAAQRQHTRVSSVSIAIVGAGLDTVRAAAVASQAAAAESDRSQPVDCSSTASPDSDA